MQLKPVLAAWLLAAALVAYAAIITVQVGHLQRRVAVLEKSQPLVQQLQTSVRALEEGKQPPRWHRLAQNTAP